MTTKTNGRKGIPVSRAPTPGDSLAEFHALVRDLGKVTRKIAKQRPPDSVRARFTDALRQVLATVGEALVKLREVEPLLEGQLAEMPQPDSEGHYPAGEALRAIVARQIAERRHKANLSQAELAQRAGVRQETVSRLESGKHAPTVRTVEKIDQALSKAGV